MVARLFVAVCLCVCGHGGRHHCCRRPCDGRRASLCRLAGVRRRSAEGNGISMSPIQSITSSLTVAAGGVAVVAWHEASDPGAIFVRRVAAGDPAPLPRASLPQARRRAGAADTHGIFPPRAQGRGGDGVGRERSQIDKDVADPVTPRYDGHSAWSQEADDVHE
jgi:hypothetical protein